MKIHIKTLDGKCFPIDIDPSETIHNLKLQLAQMTQYDVSTIRLVHTTKPTPRPTHNWTTLEEFEQLPLRDRYNSSRHPQPILPDDKTLKELNIQEGSMLHFVLMLYGG